MSKVQWTASQRRAIETVGRDVLVTASAGTGKTAVLSGRCVHRLCADEAAAEIDRLLALTFTDAAAQEMRERIGKMLQDAYRQNPSPRLARQLLLLDAAAIGTIHSFCRKLLNEYFYLANLDPSFAVLDEDQRTLIESDCLNAALEEAWQDSQLVDGLKALFNGRSLNRERNSFVDRIISLSHYLDSVAGRDAFYEHAAATTEAGGQEPLAAFYAGYFHDQLHQCRRMLLNAQSLNQRYFGDGYLLGYVQRIVEAIVRPAIELADRQDIAGLGRLVQDADFSGMPKQDKNKYDPAQSGQVKSIVDKAKETIKKMQEFVILNPKHLAAIGSSVSQQTRTLVELLQRFDRQYAAAKRRLNALDFADLEHQALSLLTAHPAAAEAIASRYDFILVDEYQDINAVQQSILSAVSRRDNVFVVGDVKQSIYGFRQSCPDIFLQRLAQASDSPDAADMPLRVDLKENYRSRKEILDFANAVFMRIMQPSIAGMTYDARAMLTAGFKYPPLADGQAAESVELTVLDETDDSKSKTGDGTDDDPSQPQDDSDEPQADSGGISSAQRQAAYIADRIQQMVGTKTGKAEFQVWDKAAEQMRDVRYGDIVILMRAMSHAAAYVEMLRLAQIPVSSQSACGYFEATEVADCLALLKTLDNPLRSIELAAVLRSALFGFTDTELAKICLADGSRRRDARPLYDRMMVFAGQAEDVPLERKIRAAFERLEQWRQLSRCKPLAEVIWHIFETTGFLAFVAALPNGQQRKANLLKLHDRAVQFGGFAAAAAGAAGISEFVAFLEDLLEEDKDWAAAEPDSSQDNSVRMMSIHKSKGLEFPVVFLAELNRQFNRRDTAGDCLIDANMLGLELIDADRGLRLATPIHQLIKLRQKQKGLAEEMRILYVAMTRARERLVITASRTQKKCAEIIARCAATEPLEDWQLGQAGALFDWLLMALAHQPAFVGLFDGDAASESVVLDLLTAKRIGRAQLEKMTRAILEDKKNRLRQPSAELSAAAQSAAAATVEQVAANLAWRYPCQPLTTLPAKYSVSELTHRDDEFARPELSYALSATPLAVSAEKTPAGSMGLLVGSAVHLVYQHLDLSSPVNVLAVEAVIGRLVQQGLILPAAIGLLDAAAIATFFQTDCGRQATGNAAGVLREWPFTMALPAEYLDVPAPEEWVVVQGIIDMLIPTPQGLIIVDFKSDNVSLEEIPQRAHLYGEQLRLYARAARAVIGLPVLAAYLYFVQHRQLFAIAV